MVIKKVKYQSLSNEEKTKLRNQYLLEIEDTGPNEYEDLNIFCCCNMQQGISEESFYNSSAEHLLKSLISVSDTPKIFFKECPESEINDLLLKIKNNEKINFNDKCPYLRAQVFIKLVKTSNDMFLPYEINKQLFSVYLNNKRNLQKIIVQRIPFILNKRDRIFFQDLNRLFNEIANKNEITKMTKSDLLYLFGPITFKFNIEGKHIFGYHRTVLLAEVLEADFENIQEDVDELSSD